MNKTKSMDKKISTSFGIIVVAVIAVFFGGLLWLDYQNQQEDKQQPCTMEAKLCPDGSSVDRTGPNCEFAACPKNTNDDLVGGDKDEHGCIGSAGYSWCEEKQKCLRQWEESCN